MNPLPFLFFGLFTIFVFGIFENSVFAETFFLTRTLDIEKNILQNTLINIANYEKVFPEYVKSVRLIQDSNQKAITELSMGVGIIPLSVQVEAKNLGENRHELTIISGDLKGSKIVTTLEKTWGYDGTPNMGTILSMDMSLQVSGLLAFLGIIDNDLVQYSIDSSISRMIDYSKGEIQEEKQNQITKIRKTGRS
jgi:hypothetical protein